MSEETTRNFWEVMRSFQWPDPQPIFYRLYHDDSGKPIIYTMEDLPGTYIEVDQDTYTKASHHVIVRDGKLVVLPPKIHVSKLVKDAKSGTPCHPQDVCVVIDPIHAHDKWKKTTNDID